LKLIKHSQPNNIGNVSYYYEWKNVYDLRERNVEGEGLTVNIYKGVAGTETDPNRLDYQTNPDGSTVRYIRLFGLDRVTNANGQPPPDDKIDLNRTVVDLEHGHIIFPDRYPFNNRVSFTGAPGDTLAERVPEIYGDNTTDAANNSKYYLDILTKSRRTSFSLGQVDIMEHSEDVRLNGRQLVRDVDYRIDYQLGTIDFYNSQVADPNADLQINYEYTPFLSATKKNLFGLRTEYAPSEALKLGSTVLYRTASTIDQKPRIGEEPSTALLLDGDFAYTGQSNFLTKMVDKLPGVTAAAPSAFQLSGEIARSMPNPNTLGKAFIDDFEGSRDFLNLGIRRGTWTASSAPVGKNLSSRGKLAWFTPDPNIRDTRNRNLPVERFRVLEIFPDRSVPSVEERMDVLELRYYPDTASAGVADPASWAGIMRRLGPGLQNHQETRLLEFWVLGRA
jgi:cell surface protein SprA